MQDFETEEQQLEALKKWWKENSSSLFFGLAIGLAGVFGWQYYGEHRENHAFEASDLYTSISQQIASGQFTDVEKLDKLRGEYTDTPYAVMAALAVASYDYDNGKVEDAISQLRWAIEHSADDNTTYLAKIRLATVYVGEKKLDEAESILKADFPQAFEARQMELMGDMYVARGKHDAAREAYDKALAAGAASLPWVKLKRDNVGSGDDVTAESEPVS